MNPQMILVLVTMAVFSYFTMIRPENKKKKEQAQMRDNVSVGDTITTIGGLMGKVVHVNDDTLTFETSEDRVRIQIVKAAVSIVGNNTQNSPGR